MRQYLFPALLLLSPIPAAADISLTGEAKMGLSATATGAVQTFGGARVTAHGYGTTDGGIEYGAVLDLDGTRYGKDVPRGYVYISGGNHNLKLGQGVNGAARELIGTLPEIGP